MVRLRWSHQTNVTTSWPSVPSAHGLGLILRRLWINVQVRTGMEFKIMKLSTLNDLLLLFCNPLSVPPFFFHPHPSCFSLQVKSRLFWWCYIIPLTVKGLSLTGQERIHQTSSSVWTSCSMRGRCCDAATIKGNLIRSWK